MKNRKLIRHTMLAAAITVSAANVTDAFGFQQGQYQPGQPGQQVPQGNTSVSQELNRMFQESGQQMPSMNPQELPNANTPIQGQIRPRQSQNQMLPGLNQKSPNTVQASGSEKPSLILRFFGKLRGNSGDNSSLNNQNYQPPVPPNYNSASPSTVGTSNFRSGEQNPAPTQNQSMQNAPRPAMAQTYDANRPTASQVNGARTESSQQVTNGATTPMPPRSGAAVRAASPAITQKPSTGSTADSRSTYFQPGSAPGFMSTAGASTVIQKHPAATPHVNDEFHDDFIRENRGGPVTARTRRESAEPTTPAASVSAKKNVDEFENPFQDSTDSGKPSELLDLDALIEIPHAAPQQIKTNVSKPILDAPTASAMEVPVSAPPPVVSDQLPEDSEADVKETQADDNVMASEENPFTGVQLETPNGQSSTEKVYPAGVDSELFETPAATMEDFNPNLPAIDLPPVGDKVSSEADEVKPTPPLEAPQPKVDSAFESPAIDSTNIKSQPSVDVPEALSAADTERLRQTAEQERRQRQHRQILSRAGQTGFKGYCPVALRERRELVEASPQFTSAFGLQTYMFSSAESKVAFDTDPARFAPAAGGSDVVVLVNSGEEQAGQLDFALWYRDRLYLFRSRETMTLFSKDPQRFASQY